jgi:HAE1 family hydrophobic/amphiphilic exporter-1
MAFGLGEGSEIWQPMGIAVVGGLLMSTLITLFIVPSLYAMLEVGIERRARRKAAKDLKDEAFIREQMAKKAANK